LTGLDLQWVNASEEQDPGRRLRLVPDLQGGPDLHLADRLDLCRLDATARLDQVRLHALVEILLTSYLVRAETLRLTLPRSASWIFATCWLD
jgi:hypothetical protein